MANNQQGEDSSRKRKDPPTPLKGDEEEELLSWRMDPAKSHSDWTIEVKVDGKRQATYHVHKVILSVGPKRSGYFYRLLQNESFSEQQTSTSTIELRALAAEAFPAMLDYMYSTRSAQQIVSVNNAVPLRHLVTYFDVARLRVDMDEIIGSTFSSVSKCGIMYRHAKEFNDDEIIQTLVKRYCAEISVKNKLTTLDVMESSDVEFWLAMLKENNGKRNKNLSGLIAHFCTKYQDDLDAGQFSKLMDASVLPAVSWRVAPLLLKLEKKFLPNSSSDAELSSLQDRCVTALAENWIKLSDQKESLLGLSPLLLTTVMTRAIAVTKKTSLSAEHLPSYADVAGAGTVSANGTYARSHICHNGAPIYIMKGQWNGISAVYAIELVSQRSSSTKLWVLMVHLVERQENSTRIFLYCSIFKDSEPCNILPPQNSGWRLALSGGGRRPAAVRPAPSLTFRA